MYRKFSHEEPWPSNVVMHIKTVILLKNFSFGLINFVNLSTTFFIQRFLTFFIFFIIKLFYSWGQRFLHPCPQLPFPTLKPGWRRRATVNAYTFLRTVVYSAQYIYIQVRLC